MTTVARRLRIRGRVQGVGYRATLCAVAREAGVAGWVRNTREGEVEALVQGAAGAVEQVVAWCRRGPPAAQVRAVDVEDCPIDSAFAGFEQRRTL